MLRETLGIRCSERCELLLAMTNVLAPERLLEVAHSLAMDTERAAVRIAERLTELPREDAVWLSRSTLVRAGVHIPRLEDL